MNVLVSASRPDHPHFAAAERWLRNARKDSQVALVILPVVAAGSLRVVRFTHVFTVPTPHTEALRFLRALLATPRATMPAHGAEWALFEELYERRTPEPKSVTDVWIAAAVLHLGEHLVTLDRGFRRLLPDTQLTVLDPVAS